MFSSSLRLLFHRRPRPTPAARRNSYRPKLLTLEDRSLPSVLTVTTTADSGAGSLRSEVAAAQSGDTVEFASSLKGQTISLTSGEIQIANNITINGQSIHPTVSGSNSSRILEVLGGASVTISNISLIDGQVSGASGGAILVDSNATLTANNDIFTSNQALNLGTTSGFGGAIENDGTLTVSKTTFQSNTAGFSGGAIDSFSSTGTLTVSNSKFYSNTATLGYGGAISSDDTTTLTSDTFGKSGGGNTAGSGSGAVDAFGAVAGTTTLTVSRGTFTDNKVTGTSGYGGAISTTDILSVSNSTFTGNSAPYGGGAIDYFIKNTTTTGYSSSLTLTDNTFTSNSAEGGGAVYSNVDIASGSVTVTITDNTFTLNTATGTAQFVYGGGLDLYQTTSGTGSASATLINDTFFQNTSTNHGGGLAVTVNNTGTGTNTATLTSLTVNQNTASTDGGGLYISGGAASVDNSILDGNTVTATGYTGPEDVTVGVAGTLTDVGWNLVGTSDTQFSTAKNDILNNTTGLATSLAKNGAPGGVPKTLALSTTSVAYEKGDQSLAGQAGALGQDERGFSRVSGKVSIGAEDPDA
jgi:predicted outer membrane repeat protein